jgi:translation elongation factor EF-1alpha
MLIYDNERYTVLVTRRYLDMPEVQVGTVTDFFAKPVVAGIELSGTLSVGDTIHIKGRTTDMELVVESMQINRVDVTEGKPGDLVGVKIPERVRPGDTVWKVSE